MQSEGDVLAYLASATWDLIRTVVILATLSAAIFRALLDFGGRAFVQRWWTEQRLHSAAMATLNQGRASVADLYSLDHRQLCAQISAAAQFDLQQARVASPLLTALVGRACTDLPDPQSTESVACTRERLSQGAEREIDMLQAHLTQSMSRLTTDASIAISFGVISLLLALAGAPRYGQLVEVTGTLCLVQSAVALGDAHGASWFWVRWLRLLTPVFIVIALVLTFTPVIPVDVTPMLLAVIGGYSGGMLSPIFVAALARLYAPR
jgi:hypothetical protein